MTAWERAMLYMAFGSAMGNFVGSFGVVIWRMWL